jgi:hypothetical protein
VTDGRTVSSAGRFDELSPLLATSGSHLVIDQLPERRQLLGEQRYQDGASS